MSEAKKEAGLEEISGFEDQPCLQVESSNADTKTKDSDAAIAELVDRSLWNDGLLRSTDYREIAVVVRDGIVFLRGHVINTTNQQRAEAAARAIPGVLGVKSYLVADDEITKEVAGALGKIEHTYGVKFFTGTQNGVVSINGEVGSASIRSLAEKCAAEIPGVRGVINSIRSPGFDITLADQRFLQPEIGEQIYFFDGLLGPVQKVIINPNNRRVIAMVVQREISNNDRSDLGFLTGSKTGQPAGLVLIPVDTIRYMTRQSGFLHIRRAELDRYRDFDPARYISPEKAWTPPYPYCRADVLIPVEEPEQRDRPDSSR